MNASRNHGSLNSWNPRSYLRRPRQKPRQGLSLQVGLGSRKCHGACNGYVRAEPSHLRFNDLIELTSDKSFIWLGRIDNVINSGGLKLIPEDIEQKFSKCLTRRFFAAGYPDPELGERLIFVVEGEPEEGLMDRLKTCQAESGGRIMKNQVPRDIVFLPKFEETDSGKINRKKILGLIRPGTI